MAKIHLDRLKEKYGDNVSGENYKELMSEIIANNHENIQRATARLSKDHYEKAAAKIKRSTAKQIAVPSLEEVLPKRSVYLRKGAEQGQMIADALRDKLTNDLRETVKDYLKTGKESMQYRKGENRGRIKQELINKMRDRFKERAREGGTQKYRDI